MSTKNIAVMAGYWSTNIGNSFFQLGAEYLMKQIFPNDNVFIFADQPGYWNVSKGNPANSLPLLENMQLDYLVIQGPFLRPEFNKIWQNTLRELQKNGTKIIVLAAGMMKYDDKNVRQYRRWLEETPPFIFSTRDSDTYKGVHDLAEHSYDGVDTALFVADIFEPPALNFGDYIVYNFDKWPEPQIWYTGDSTASGVPDISFEFDSHNWNVKFPSFRKGLVQKSRLIQTLDSWIPEKVVDNLNGYHVVRTDHRTNPFYLRNTHRRPNTFAHDLPQGYLALYANTKLTLSNRVHACVATMVYGNSAMLFSATPRARLLDRLGATEISERPVRLDLDYISTEKRKMTEWLKSVVE